LFPGTESTKGFSFWHIIVVLHRKYTSLIATIVPNELNHIYHHSSMGNNAYAEANHFKLQLVVLTLAMKFMIGEKYNSVTNTYSELNRMG
jgi:hypothetical protein